MSLIRLTAAAILLVAPHSSMAELKLGCDGLGACEWAAWGTWEPCDSTCGGHRVRQREICCNIEDFPCHHTCEKLVHREFDVCPLKCEFGHKSDSTSPSSNSGAYERGFILVGKVFGSVAGAMFWISVCLCCFRCCCPPSSEVIETTQTDVYYVPGVEPTVTISRNGGSDDVEGCVQPSTDTGPPEYNQLYGINQPTTDGSEDVEGGVHPSVSAPPEYSPLYSITQPTTDGSEDVEGGVHPSASAPPEYSQLYGITQPTTDGSGDAEGGVQPSTASAPPEYNQLYDISHPTTGVVGGASVNVEPATVSGQ